MRKKSMPCNRRIFTAVCDDCIFEEPNTNSKVVACFNKGDSIVVDIYISTWGYNIAWWGVVVDDNVYWAKLDSVAYDSVLGGADG